MRILGIETSCDETAAAVVEATEERMNVRTKEQNSLLVHPFLRFSVLSNVVASQITLHKKTGGVVPEVAARAHLEQIIPVIEEALWLVNPKSKIPISKQIQNPNDQNSKQFSITRLHNYPITNHIDLIAVTYGPGLLTSLLVGIETARTLSWLTGLPLARVNHLEGHIYANMLASENMSSKSQIAYRSDDLQFAICDLQFPALALLVSGGHTELVLMRRHLDYKVLGSTRDDAAGECFDKVAKMLNLGYPGGPEIARLADNFRLQIANCKFEKSAICNLQSAIDLPRPMIDSQDYDFSFSGLKTAVLYWLRANRYYTCHSRLGRGRSTITGIIPVSALCAEIENAIVEVLVSKTIRAAKEYKVKTVMLGGGVAANKYLRKELGKAISSYLPPTSYLLPPLSYTTDNAAMIAAAGYFRAKYGRLTSWEKLKVEVNAELD
jgi:N6-L-threonylcarbamoyladenine synthase